MCQSNDRGSDWQTKTLAAGAAKTGWLGNCFCFGIFAHKYCKKCKQEQSLLPAAWYHDTFTNIFVVVTGG